MNNNPNGNPNQDANLLHFLKNQSLFNQSPTRRMSSRSRDRKSDRNRSPGQVNGNYSYNVGTTYQQGSPMNIQDNNRTVTYTTNVQGGQIQGGQVQQVQIPQNVQTTYTTTTNNGYGIQGQQMQGNVQGNYVTTTTETNQMNQGMLSTAAGLVQNLVTYSSSF